MPEREQHHQSVIGGNLTEEAKRRILDDEKRFFDYPELSGITELERVKTETEERITELVREFGDRIDEAVGAPKFPIPAKNIHIIPGGNWPEQLGSTGAIFNSETQQIAIRETESHLQLAHEAFHEYMHLKSFGSLQVTGDSLLAPYRAGLTTIDRNNDKEFFRLINEAITEELAISFIHEVKHLEPFRDETEQVESLKGVFGKSAFTENGSTFFDDELYFLTAQRNEDGAVDFNGQSFTYPQERAALNTLISKTVERYQLGDLTVEEVKHQFLIGYITGNILPIGKLIDSTFGKGTFRAIGAIEDPDELTSFVGNL